MGVLVVPHPQQHLLCQSFFNFSHSNQCDATCGFNLHSLVNNNVEYLFMCLIAICTSSLLKYTFKSFAHFIRLFVFLLCFENSLDINYFPCM